MFVRCFFSFCAESLKGVLKTVCSQVLLFYPKSHRCLSDYLISPTLLTIHPIFSLGINEGPSDNVSHSIEIWQMAICSIHV